MNFGMFLILAPPPPLNPLASFRQRAYNNMIGSTFGSVFRSDGNNNRSSRIIRKHHLPHFSFRNNRVTADSEIEQVKWIEASIYQVKAAFVIFGLGIYGFDDLQAFKIHSYRKNAILSPWR